MKGLSKKACPESKRSNLSTKLVHNIDDDDQLLGTGDSFSYKKLLRPKLVYLLLVSLLSCTFIFTDPHLFSSSYQYDFSLFYSIDLDKDHSLSTVGVGGSPLCSSLVEGTICCDRSSTRADICYMKGDVRTDSVSSSVFLYVSTDSKNKQHQEKIKPYTRKWETNVMDTIHQLNLVSKKQNEAVNHGCDVQHHVPAIFFSTGGYTGNLYHEFNDGLLPLYITCQQYLNKKVVFVILEYHDWWIMKYGNILSSLSDYPIINYSRDKRTHCFPQATVGLRIHDELTVDPSLVQGNKSIVDFRQLLDRAYWPRIKGLIQQEKRGKVKDRLPLENQKEKPKLVILSRNGSRAITNEDSLVKMAEKIGFSVVVLRPNKRTEMAKIYKELNSSDVMLGVHGAAMTHFLFMKPRCVFIQVIPLGTDWAAETYYGEPARKLGLKYTAYKILPKESSLYDEYDENDAVLTDPNTVNNKGWNYTKKIYLDTQNVKLNLPRFYKRLARAYGYSIARKKSLTLSNNIL